ncbi:hypothetical protein MNV_1020005 [Candidatus Methanoperedens nitroreducens]|uniref:Uncharacterized protein n=1 Tax=Candidatus Methanoperedens nitratireducens TaxID=1392998 RepID=A0A284VIA3_9EURY|nr:hypothetical protein MNV_1020005 [Candidatus Methanoperedens nitroreducens]
MDDSSLHSFNLKSNLYKKSYANICHRSYLKKQPVFRIMGFRNSKKQLNPKVPEGKFRLVLSKY